jgi:2-methylisocitrate lyase-like PEP mutase family enzyme
MRGEVMSEQSKKMREIFNRKGDPVVCISAPTPLAARLLERAGFEYIFLGGEATFGTMVGTPGSYLDTTEKVGMGKYFVKAVSIPVIMDCDEVCGRGPAFIERAVEQYTDIGLAGMDIDDRVLPEESGAGQTEHEHEIDSVVSIDEMVAKIEAGAAVKRSVDPDFVLRVRCYEFGNRVPPDWPLEKTIERLQAYEKAGADILYLGEIGSPEDVDACVKATNVPCTVPGMWVTYDIAKELGLCEARYPYELVMAMNSAGWEFLTDFKKRGLQASADIRERLKGNPYMAEAGHANTPH